MKIENENYALMVDSNKNLYTVKIKNSPMTMDKMKQFVKDQLSLLDKLKPEMLVLSDMSEAPMLPREAMKELQVVQEFAMKIGVKKDARVVSKSEIANMALQTTDKASGLKDALQYFDSLENARNWLLE